MALRRGALRLNAAVERRPVVTAVAVTATKAVVADLMVQLLLERREAVDTRRSALFGTFGGAYQGAPPLLPPLGLPARLLSGSLGCGAPGMFKCECSNGRLGL